MKPIIVMLNFILLSVIFKLGMPVSLAGVDGPWSSHIKEERNLTTCENTSLIYNAAVILDVKLQGKLDDPNVPDEVKTIVKAEQEGLWQLEHDLTIWMESNCKEA